MYLVHILCGYLFYIIGIQAHLPECKKSWIGFEYQGVVNMTSSGRACQSWSSQTPHSHPFTDHREFPDFSMAQVNNYCRNPNDRDGGPWCFTEDPDVEWEYCDITWCHDMPECRWSESGEEYRGSVAVTAAGKPCQPWPNSQPSHNYCRNPAGLRAAPWCYTDEIASQWELCDIAFCKSSMNCKRTAGGEEFVGTRSSSRTGRTCQRWDSQAPHPHNFTDPQAYPDLTLEDAANYCRNPDGSSSGPWCYTTDPLYPKDSCLIPTCQECKLTTLGREYSGGISMTTSGLACQAWSDQAPHPHNMADSDRFPDANLSSASNFCRNPDSKEKGPWCFTTDPDTEWEYCDVPICSDDKPTAPRPAKAKHVLHIGIDGLRPDCIPQAPGGAPNILQRLGGEGAWTLERARTVLETVSGPGWTSVLCGMASERTGVLNNLWTPTWQGANRDITPILGTDAAFPCINNVLKEQDANIRTGFFYDWEFIKYIANRGRPGSVDKEFWHQPVGTDWLTSDIYLTGNATEYLRDVLVAADSSYTFVYLLNVDNTGHLLGWCGNAYMNAVDAADNLVGDLLNVLDDLGMADDVAVVLTADHGGEGIVIGHGFMRDEDIHVPMFLRGPGIRVNHQFEFEVQNEDVAPTIAYILGYDRSPWWTGRAMWEAFENP